MTLLSSVVIRLHGAYPQYRHMLITKIWGSKQELYAEKDHRVWFKMAEPIEELDCPPAVDCTDVYFAYSMTEPEYCHMITYPNGNITGAWACQQAAVDYAKGTVLSRTEELVVLDNAVIRRFEICKKRS